MALPSVMSHSFGNIPPPEIQRSTFDRSRGLKTTFDAGKLYPMFLDEVVPGDTIKLNTTLFARVATLIQPIMDNVYIDTFFFYVPYRLCWSNWEKFMGSKDDLSDTTEYEVPSLYGDPYIVNEGTLGDYFGLPTKVDFHTDERISALPFRAYNLIFNEWFRDQNLEGKAPVYMTDGPDNIVGYNIVYRAKRPDYFTTCLPWPQKGDPITLPIGTSAPVIGDGKALGFNNGVNNLGLFTNNTSPYVTMLTGAYGGAVGAVGAGSPPLNNRNVGVTTDPTKSGLVADLSSALAATVNQLREAFAFQTVLERDARGGTRYVEIIKAQFGQTVPDFRLQRPEYLGGHSQRIDVRAVAQTSETASELGTPQANLSAYTQVSSESGFTKSFVEHGMVIGLVNVRSDITYQQGLHKMWSRSSRFDFYLPALANLGEQPVLTKEIYYADTGTGAETVFGYQERWAEMRYGVSQLTGKMRQNSTGPLTSWHLGTYFSSAPTLSSSWIQDRDVVDNLDRVIAVTNEPQIVMDMFHKMAHTRPMPTYSVPGLGQRF